MLNAALIRTPSKNIFLFNNESTKAVPRLWLKTKCFNVGYSFLI